MNYREDELPMICPIDPKFMYEGLDKCAYLIIDDKKSLCMNYYIGNKNSLILTDQLRKNDLAGWQREALFGRENRIFQSAIYFNFLYSDTYE